MRATALLLISVTLACGPAISQPRRTTLLSEQYQYGEARLAGGETLLDILRRNRPTLLKIREVGFPLSSDAPDPIGVYVDGLFIGGLDALQSIPAEQVFSVRRLRGIDARNRFASRHREGVLEVRLIRR